MKAIVSRTRTLLSHPRAIMVLYIEIAALLLGALTLLPGGFDYLHFFYPLAEGCESCSYNPYFTEWFVAPFRLLAWRESYLLFMLISVVLLFWAARQLGGNPLVALGSMTFVWVLWLGQIDILVGVGLAIAWASVKTDRATLAGVGLLLMATKPQLAGFAIVALAVWAGPRALIMPALGALVSFVQYGIDWPVRWLAYTPEVVFSGDAWFYISPLWLLFCLIGVFFVKGRRKQLQYVIAATTLGAPYLGAYSFFVLLLFPVRWWEIAIGYMPFALIGISGDQAWLGLLLLQPALIATRLLLTSNAPIPSKTLASQRASDRPAV